MAHPLDELIYVTVRIRTFGAEDGVATGFLFLFGSAAGGGKLCLVTNKHVLEGATCGELVFTQTAEDGQPDFGNHRTIFIENFEGAVFHEDDDVDLVAIPLEPILAAQSVEIDSIYTRALGMEAIMSDADIARLFAIEDVSMIGYPEGLWDELNNLPVVRRGVTATPIARDYDGTTQFLIDCAVFTGSSGSPAFLFNPAGYVDKGKDGSISMIMSCRIALVGILWGNAIDRGDGPGPAPVPTCKDQSQRQGTAMHIGYCEKASSLREFEAYFAPPTPIVTEIVLPSFSFDAAHQSSHPGTGSQPSPSALASPAGDR